MPAPQTDRNRRSRGRCPHRCRPAWKSASAAASTIS